MSPSSPARPIVQKTLKLYIAGAFVRSESGRVVPQQDFQGGHVAQLPNASRKDMRDAVLAARNAAKGWARTTPFLRSQILYRLAEMVQGRAAVYREILVRTHGYSADDAARELDDTLDTLVYFAGWCDKYTSVFGGVNPVAAPFLNLSTLEPMGVLAGFLPESRPLTSAAAAIAIGASTGNTALWFAPPSVGQVLLELAESVATSDLPPGVCNLLVAAPNNLREDLGSHRDINAFVVHEGDNETRALLERMAAESVARVVVWPWGGEPAKGVDAMLSPWPAVETLEVKTAWHPLGG